MSFSPTVLFENENNTSDHPISNNFRKVFHCVTVSISLLHGLLFVISIPKILYNKPCVQTGFKIVILVPYLFRILQYEILSFTAYVIAEHNHIINTSFVRQQNSYETLTVSRITSILSESKHQNFWFSHFSFCKNYEFGLRTGKVWHITMLNGD